MIYTARQLKKHGWEPLGVNVRANYQATIQRALFNAGYDYLNHKFLKDVVFFNFGPDDWRAYVRLGGESKSRKSTKKNPRQTCGQLKGKSAFLKF